MATSGDGRAPYKSSGSKRPFQSEIHEEPQNVSQEAGRKNSSGVSETHQGGSSAATGISKFEQMLKQMSFTRSEAQYLIELLHSRTIEESPSDNLGALRQVSKLVNNNAICLSKTPPQHPATIENLPADVLSNIFIRLLAKQLAQMRSVSKYWNALLSESSFIKSHLHHHSIQKKDNPLLHFSSEFSRGFETFLENPTLKLTEFIKLPIRKRSQHDCDLKVIGSVNGLICSSYDDSVIHIWNPSLSAVLTLPPYSLPCNGYEWIKVFFRFGFDPKNDDYKVVKLTSFADTDSNVVIWWMDVEVYSMRKGSWKLIPERFPSHITWIDEHEVVCVDGPNGNLHWLGCIDEDTDSKTIVAFDLGSEKFREIRLPRSVEVIENHRYKSLGVFAGKLCVMVWNENNACEVWAMKVYGVAESWVKCHASRFIGDTYPFGFTSANKFLIQNHNSHLVLYNPFTKQAQILKDDFSYEEYEAGKFVEYVDSLVWVTPAKHEKVDGV